MQDDRRGDRHLRRARRDRVEKRQMLREDRARPFDRFVNDELLDRDRLAVLVAMKKIALLGSQAAGSQSLPKKIDDIALTPELPVTDRMQADRFLERDDLANRLVLDPFELGAVDQALSMLLARLDQVRGSQQAADLIGAKGRCASRGIHFGSVPDCG